MGMYNKVLLGCMIFLAICTFFCLVRAIKGPRFTDRLVGINMIGTIGVVFICMLSVYLREAFLVDVALVYTLLSFLTVVILCRVVMLHHQGRLLAKKREEAEQNG